MGKLILSRLLQLPVILGVVFLLTFTLAWIVPGNPLDRGGARQPDPVAAEAMRRQYNLDSPAAFMGNYLHDLLLGSERYGWPDFGPSLSRPGVRVRTILAEKLPVSMLLGALGIAIALLLGTFAGVVGALRPGSGLDFASLTVALVGISLPSFVTGSVLLAVFAGVLRWLPIGGWEGFGEPRYWVLPAVTLAVAPAAYIARLIRLGLAEVMASDFIRTARAKGVSRSRALFRHALKVAYLPVLSFLGPAAAGAMTGSFVVEVVFNVPGLGQQFVDGVLAKDQFLILGVVLVYATILIVFNLAVDVGYAWLDPRISLD